jgi:hypothetical protein
MVQQAVAPLDWQVTDVSNVGCRSAFTRNYDVSKQPTTTIRLANREREWLKLIIVEREFSGGDQECGNRSCRISSIRDWSISNMVGLSACAHRCKV